MKVFASLLLSRFVSLKLFKHKVNSKQSSTLSGGDLDERLETMFSERGVHLPSKTLRQLKENCFCVSNNHTTTDLPMNYILPDGRSISLGSERFEIPELLFKPQSIDEDIPSVSSLVHSCIYQCAIDIRRDLLNSICLTGGTAKMKGFAQRLKKEIKSTVPRSVAV